MTGDGRWSMTEVDLGRCRAVAEHLRLVNVLLGSYVEKDPFWEGHAGSQARKEAAEARQLGGVPFEIALRASYSMMHLGLFSAVLHLKAIAALLELEDPLADSVTLLARAVLELSARAWWLADPSLSTEQRTARGFLEKIESAKEAKKLKDACDPSGNGVGEVAEPLEALYDELQSTPLSVNATRTTIQGQHRPTATALLASFPGNEIAASHERFFRLFSATSHGTLYGLTLLFDVPPPDDMGKTTATYRVTQAWLDGPVSTAILALCWAVQRVGALLAWDEGPLNSYLEDLDNLYAEDESQTSGSR